MVMQLDPYALEGTLLVIAVLGMILYTSLKMRSFMGLGNWGLVTGGTLMYYFLDLGNEVLYGILILGILGLSMIGMMAAAAGR